jgi:hypothetical protein
MQQGKLMLQAAKERAQQSGITDPITSLSQYSRLNQL